jgi:HNH endonuclease
MSWRKSAKRPRSEQASTSEPQGWHGLYGGTLESVFVGAHGVRQEDRMHGQVVEVYGPNSALIRWDDGTTSRVNPAPAGVMPPPMSREVKANTGQLETIAPTLYDVPAPMSWEVDANTRQPTVAPTPSDVPKRHVRKGLTQAVKNQVWRRDEGRCVECGSQERLEFDHIIPVSKDGSNTARNVQLLCERCNRTKGSNL